MLKRITNRAGRLLLACALLAFGFVFHSTPAAMADGEVIIEVTSITPEVLSSEMPVTVHGVITNGTSQVLNDVQVALQVNRNRIETRDELLEVDAAPVNIRPNQPTVVDQLATLRGIVRAGQTASFTLTFDPQAQGMTPGAVYSLEVLAQQRNRTQWVSLASSRSMLTYLNGAGDSVNRPQAVTTVLLNAQPSLILPQVTGSNPAPAVFADEYLGDELDTRLNALLAYASRPGITVVIDPLLLDEVTAMANGYVVAGEDGTTTPGAHQARASDWLNRFYAMLVTSPERCYRGLSGTPEFGAFTDASYAEIVAAAADTLAPSHPLFEVPLAVVSLTGRFTEEHLEFLSAAAPAVLIADTVAETTRMRIGSDPTLVAAVNTTARNGSPTAELFTAMQRRMWMGAEQFLAWQTGMPLVTVIDDPAQITMESSTESVANRVPLRNLEPEEAPISWIPPRAAAVEVPVELIDLAMSTADDFSKWSLLSPTPDPVRLNGNTAISGAWSVSWGDDWGAAMNWLQQRSDPVRAALADGDVVLTITPVWYIGADTIAMPVQVTNTMNFPVLVQVVFATEHEQRLHIPMSDFVTIAPGETESIRVEPEVYGNGSLLVTAHIQDVHGNAVGGSVQFTVNASSAGTLAWLIIIGAGAAFLVATGMRVRHVRRYGKESGVDRRPLVTRLRNLFENDDDTDTDYFESELGDTDADTGDTDQESPDPEADLI